MHLSFPPIYATLILGSSYLGWWITCNKIVFQNNLKYTGKYYVLITWKVGQNYIKESNWLFPWNSRKKTHIAYGRNVQTTEVGTGDKYTLKNFM